MIEIPAGTYQLGTDDGYGFVPDREGPSGKIELEAFSIGSTSVTNAEFADFIQATDYVTVAERTGFSLVFDLLLDDETKESSMFIQDLPWWRLVRGASWHQPQGPDSTLVGLEDHPVVHVAHEDALAYCAWRGVQLPTEAQWQAAAADPDHPEWTFPWGMSLNPEGRYLANTWQGNFPKENTQADGYLGTAPVKTYPPTSRGLYQMVGNVWEWCSNPGRLALEDFQVRSAQDFWQDLETQPASSYAIKGGSFLCHSSYCNRYRIAARNQQEATSTSSNLGFRVVKNTWK